MARKEGRKQSKRGWKKGRPRKGTTQGPRLVPGTKQRIVNYIQLFVALMIGVEGLDLTVTANKLVSVYPFMWGVGLLMVIGGFTWALYILKPELFIGKDEDEEGTEPEKVVDEPRRLKTIAERVIGRLTMGGRLVKLFPVVGIILVIIDLFYNYHFYGSISYDELGTHDIVALLFAGILIIYPYIPKGWEKERDFAFFFSVGLIVFLIVPLLVIRAESASQEGAVDQYAAWLLAKPLAGMLGVLGIEANAFGIYVEFAVSDGTLATLGITTSCSGIYSFTIFSAAFVSFVMVEYHKLKLRVLGLMALGVFMAYLANLLRMLVITLVGHWFDTSTSDLEYTLWAHANAGWLIFLVWIALFWWLMFKFVMKGEVSDEGFEKIDLDEDIFCSQCSLQIDNEKIPDKCPECGQVFEFQAEE